MHFGTLPNGNNITSYFAIDCGITEWQAREVFSGKPESISSIFFDHWFSNQNSIAELIKIDVESAEGRFLRGQKIQ